MHLASPEGPHRISQLERPKKEIHAGYAFQSVPIVQPPLFFALFIFFFLYHRTSKQKLSLRFVAQFIYKYAETISYARFKSLPIL